MPVNPQTIIPSRDESEQAIQDFARSLRGLQGKVFKSLAAAAFARNPEVGWKSLRSACWPESDTGTGRGHVDGVVKEVEKKADAWSTGKAVTIAVTVVSQPGRDAKKWKVAFASASKASVSEFRPRFSWWFSVKKERGQKMEKPDKRLLPVWVPLFDKESIQVNVLPKGSWPIPRSFPNYKAHREASWREYENACRTANSRRPLLTQHWHVAKCSCVHDPAHGYPQVDLHVSRLDYADFQATTERLARQIAVGTTTQTVYEILRKDWSPDDHQHFPPAANLLAVDVNVITRDGKLVVRRERENGPWETAIFGYVDALEDVHRNDTHIPTPRETVFRKCCQLLGLSIRPAFIRWLGIGLGTKKGNVSLFGEVKISQTYSQLHALFASRPDTESSRQIAAIDLARESAPKSLCGLLDEAGRQHRRHVEVALVLSLARRYPNVKIETNVTAAGQIPPA